MNYNEWKMQLNNRVLTLRDARSYLSADGLAYFDAISALSQVAYAHRTASSFMASCRDHLRRFNRSLSTDFIADLAFENSDKNYSYWTTVCENHLIGAIQILRDIAEDERKSMRSVELSVTDISALVEILDNCLSNFEISGGDVDAGSFGDGDEYTRLIDIFEAVAK